SARPRPPRTGATPRRPRADTKPARGADLRLTPPPKSLPFSGLAPVRAPRGRRGGSRTMGTGHRNSAGRVVRLGLAAGVVLLFAAAVWLRVTHRGARGQAARPAPRAPRHRRLRRRRPGRPGDLHPDQRALVPRSVVAGAGDRPLGGGPPRPAGPRRLRRRRHDRPGRLSAQRRQGLRLGRLADPAFGEWWRGAPAVRRDEPRRPVRPDPRRAR